MLLVEVMRADASFHDAERNAVLGALRQVFHLADDEATKVIALYVETVRNPQKFRAAALKAARAGKPVVAFKIGRSEAVLAEAIAEHSEHGGGVVDDEDVVHSDILPLQCGDAKCLDSVALVVLMR